MLLTESRVSWFYSSYKTCSVIFRSQSENQLIRETMKIKILLLLLLVGATTIEGNRRCGLKCGIGFVLDFPKCKCIADPNYTIIAPCGIRCATGFIIDNVNCKCINDPSFTTPCQLGCPSNFVLDEINCQCIPPPTTICNKKCQEGAYFYETLNTRNCKCERVYCDVFCQEGQIIDTVNCISCSQCPCIPDPKFTSSLISSLTSEFNTIIPQTTTECSITCQEGTILNLNICDCDPDPNNTTRTTTTITPIPTTTQRKTTKCGITCRKGAIVNFNRCQCVPDPNHITRTTRSITPPMS